MYTIIAIVIVIAYYSLRIWGIHSGATRRRKYRERKAINFGVYEFLR